MNFFSEREKGIYFVEMGSGGETGRKDQEFTNAR